MNNSSYNLQFDKLFAKLDLGVIIDEPRQMTGGLMHKMFEIKTASHKYAVKALNPQIMLREKAMQNLIDSENIALIATKNISAIAAKRFNGKSIQEFNRQYYFIFNYTEGKSLCHNEITIEHCKKMGAVLAEIHKTDFSSLNLIDNYSSEETLTDWNYYLKTGIECNTVWVEILSKNINNLYNWNNNVITSAKLLSENTVISHGDLESKNVIWQNEIPYIIDWEAAGFIHPVLDVLETAIYWSNDGYDNIDKQKFMVFIESYKNKNSFLKFIWQPALQKSYSSRLGWLEYSLKRSLKIECADEAEQKIGTEHVIGTINSLLKYSEKILQLEEWLR